MVTMKAKDGNGSEVETKHKPGMMASSSTVRVKQKTRTKLEQLLRQANKDRVGRKIKANDVIEFSLSLLTDDHISEICNKSLSNKDRIEVLFRKVSKEQRGITRDEFFGMLLDGKVSI